MNLMAILDMDDFEKAKQLMELNDFDVGKASNAYMSDPNFLNKIANGDQPNTSPVEEIDAEPQFEKPPDSSRKD